MITYEITVRGSVQGVGFRYFVQRNAAKLGVNGYIKNMPNGEVFIIAQGPIDIMDDFIALVKAGPAMADVSEVHINECQPMAFTTFTIKH